MKDDLKECDSCHDDTCVTISKFTVSLGYHDMISFNVCHECEMIIHDFNDKYYEQIVNFHLSVQE